MARLKTLPVSFAERIQQTLRSGLAHGGIKADVEVEAVPGTRLQRVLVTAPNFRQLRPSERQDLVWRIIDQEFEHDEQLLISMIMTLTPNELRGNWDSPPPSMYDFDSASTREQKRRKSSR